MKRLIVSAIYLVLRYFCAHDKVLILRSGDVKQKTELDKIIRSISPMLGEKLIVSGEGRGAFKKLGIIWNLAQAKIVCVHKEKLLDLCSQTQNRTDIVTYELNQGTLKFTKTRGVIKKYRYDVQQYSDYHKLASYLVNFSRIGCKASWLERSADGLLKISIFNTLTAFFFRLFPKDSQKIVIRSCHHQYNCNPKYIVDEMLKDSFFVDRRIYWLLETHPATKVEAFPSRVKLLKNRSFRAKYHLSTARVVIDNSVLKDISYVSKRQILVQTWHGSLGIKRFDGAWDDRVGRLNEARTSFCVSNSAFETQVFRDTYWKNTPIFELGHARNSIFFQDNYILKKQIRTSLGIKDGQKIVLYAPTFRDLYRGKSGSENIQTLRPYSIARQEVVEGLTKRFGGEWIWLDRFHFHLRKYKQFSLQTKSESILNVSDYPDIQDLLLIADVVITDYSSLIFDFMLTGLPAFIYATDLDEYEKNDRAFFYPIEDTPFPIATTMSEMLENIARFDEVKYKQNVNMFLNGKGCVDGAVATIRLIYKIKEKIKE
ncbi:CDP-glycerol glycerophosphotransferase family protein [Escherichia coli]|jgi:CDP-glycerol glycerophosphotransferase|uniref:CDP-glycerol glycerophosphotransferase family protein n=1 Tax=Escherichia coli TaxID=562 RepID=UPI000B957622|nr:CDP-glycerol glycerophosphotransferase family protein [Escherichia coli]OYJ40918.1 hypothetical protein CI737_12860 [Escherichia coli]HCE1028126.1 CDP-glycerol glycerophosphotransferase family protein [Escherichia coli]